MVNVIKNPNLVLDRDNNKYNCSSPQCKSNKKSYGDAIHLVSSKNKGK